MKSKFSKLDLRTDIASLITTSMAYIRGDNPYPDDIFTEPTKKEWKALTKLMKKNGMAPDQFFGSWGRKVWNNCVDKIEEHLCD